MAKVGPNAVNLAIAEMIGHLLTLTTHPNAGKAALVTGEGLWSIVRQHVHL